LDKQFLEFWGHFLINAAKSQKQLEEMDKWLNKGLTGFEDFTAMFRKFYGLNGLQEGTTEYLKTWENAANSLQKSYKEYLNLMGMVPRNEHLALIKKYEDLKQEVADQAETIKHLRMLLNARGADDQAEVIKSFQDLMNKQSKQFQELTENFGRFFQKKGS